MRVFPLLPGPVIFHGVGGPHLITLPDVAMSTGIQRPIGSLFQFLFCLYPSVQQLRHRRFCVTEDLTHCHPWRPQRVHLYQLSSGFQFPSVPVRPTRCVASSSRPGRGPTGSSGELGRRGTDGRDHAATLGRLYSHFTWSEPALRPTVGHHLYSRDLCGALP